MNIYEINAFNEHAKIIFLKQAVSQTRRFSLPTAAVERRVLFIFFSQQHILSLFFKISNVNAMTSEWREKTLQIDKLICSSYGKIFAHVKS